MVPRDGDRVRQGAGAVRPPHRPVPGGQAPPGRHGGACRADDRPGVGRGRGRGTGRRSAGVDLAVATAAVRWPSTATCGAPRSVCSCSGGIGFTWEHDLHLHLKRALADRQLLAGPESFAHQVAAAGRRGDVGCWRPTCPTRPSGSGRSWRPVVAELAAAEGAERRRRLVEGGFVAPHWPRPWGRDAGAVEQVVIDEQMAAAGIDPTPHRDRRLGAPGHHRLRQRRAAPAVGATDPAGGAHLVPALLRARGRVGPGQPRPPGPSGWTAAGGSPARRCGRPWPGRPTGASAWPAPTPTSPSTRASPTSSWTWRSAGLDIRPLRELTGAALFNEVFFDAVFVPDDCVIGDVERRLADGPDDAGQRAGLDVVGLHLRHRRRVAAPAGRQAGRRPRPPVPRPGSAPCWPRPSRSG